MNRRIVLIAIIIIFLLLIIIAKQSKESKVLMEVTKDLGTINRKKSVDIQSQRNELRKINTSLKNVKNLHEYINDFSQNPPQTHQRYLKIYEKIFDYQTVYLIFYESDYIYHMEYWENIREEFDINRDVSRFKLKSMLFVDGKSFDPSSNSSISQDANSFNIAEINLGKYEGRGLGSFYLDSLSTELLRYPQIKYLKGKLSPVDFKNKEKLIGFYEKNGFEDIKLMTKNSWGYVSKTLRK